MRRRRVFAVAKLSLLAGLLSAPAAAQTHTVLVRAAADPGMSGPAALVWARQEVLPHLPSWPAGLDPLGAPAD